MKSIEIRKQRAKLIHDARAIVDKASEEKREMLAEEQQQFDTFMAEADKKMEQVRGLEKLENAEKNLDKPIIEPPETNKQPDKKIEYRKAFKQMLRGGYTSLSGDEKRALQIGTDSEGGYIVPDEFETILVKALQEQNIMRQISRVITTSSDRKIPIESSISTAGWVAEEGAISTTSDPVFAQIVMNAYKAALIVKVSQELVQDAFFDVESYIAEEVGRAIGVLEEAAFANGNGTGQPTGVTSGTTGVTAASGSAITGDELIDLYHSVDRLSRAKGTWIMKDSTVKVVRKLKEKDTENQYLWQPGLQAGEPDKLLGKPLYSCDGMPAIAVNALVICFGDFQKYLIADRKGRTVQVLTELYAANDQIGVKVSQRTDGKLLQADAIKNLKMGAV